MVTKQGAAGLETGKVDGRFGVVEDFDPPPALIGRFLTESQFDGAGFLVDLLALEQEGPFERQAARGRAFAGFGGHGHFLHAPQFRERPL